MKLKKSQVRFIEQNLTIKGIHYPPLREDLLDHICTEVENRMSKGARFKDAYDEALTLFLPQELDHIQDKTMTNLTSLSLIKSYLQTACRNLLRHKSHTSINVFGLTVSISICILIFVFIRYELSYDQQHPETNIHRLVSNIEQESGEVSSTAFTAAPWGPAMVEDFPELVDAARIMKYRLDVIVSSQESNTSFYESDLIWGDQQLLQFFDINLKVGNRISALEEPNSVVISERTAKKYFGDRDAIGEVLIYNNEVSLTVTGIMEDMPENMHFKADLICSFNTLRSFWRIIDNWKILYYHTYFNVAEGADPQVLQSKFPEFFARRIGKGWTDNRSVKLQQVKKIHLTSGISDGLKTGTDPQYLYLLGLIAIIILFLACANFINLNIARSLKRSKEVGIRKVMGGLKTDLVLQFILESGLLTLFSLTLSLIVAQFLLPFFNQLLDKELTIFGRFDGLLILYLLLIIGIVSVFAGIYPAMKAARLNTLMALKGKSTSRFRATSFGDGLMLFQFAICAMLVVAIGTIKMQQQYILNKDLGYSKERLLMLSTNNIDTKDLELVKNELLSIPEIQHVSITSHKLAGDQPYYSRYTFSSPNGKRDTLGLGRLHIDENFIDTYNLKLLAGRNLNTQIGMDSAGFLINEKTADLLGVSPAEALELTINYLTQGANGRYPRTGRIIGVVENFHLESLHKKIDGLVMDIQPPRAHFIACKLARNHTNEAISKIENSMRHFVADNPLDHFYMEDHLSNWYSDEEKLDVLISIASAIAVVIAFLGLLGLISQLMVYKKREIGLRKVLGADTIGITALLSKKYVHVIMLSLLIAYPVSYFWMNNWLQNYPYRIEFPVYWMLFTGLLILGIALIAIILVTVSVANSNPISALKEE